MNDRCFVSPCEPRNKLEEECDKLVGHISIWSEKPHKDHGRSGGLMTFDADRSSHRGRYHVQSYFEDGTYAGGSDSFGAATLCERLLNRNSRYHRVAEGSIAVDSLLDVYKKTMKTISKTRVEMISDIMNDLMLSDDLSIEDLYRRFYPFKEIQLESYGLFSVGQHQDDS